MNFPVPLSGETNLIFLRVEEENRTPTTVISTVSKVILSDPFHSF